MITTGTRRHDLVGNGTAGPFTYQFLVTDKTYLLVYVAGALKTVDTHYTVTGVGDEAGGTVTFTVGNEPAVNAAVILLGAEPYTQTLALSEASQLPAASVEGALDKHIRLTGQLREMISRSPVMAVTDAYGKSAINLAAPVAGQYLRWDSLKQTIESAVPTTVPSGLPVGGNYDHLTINGSGVVAWGQQIYNFSANMLNVSKFADFATAVSTIGATVATLVITTSQSIVGNVSVPKTLRILLEGQGEFNIATGITVTFDHPDQIIANPRKRVKTGAGTLAFTHAGTVYPGWWGATGDGVTDDTTAIQTALNTGNGQTIYFPPGTYCTHNITASYSYQRIIGAGWGSLIYCTGANEALLSIDDGVVGTEVAFLKLKDTGTFNVTYRGRSLVYCNPNNGTNGVQKLNVHHCWLANGAISGISGNKILDSHFHHNIVDADGGAVGEHGIYCSRGSQRVTIDHNIMVNVGASNGAGVTSNAYADNEIMNIVVDSNIIKGFGTGIQPFSTTNYIQPCWTITNNQLIGTVDSTGSGIDLFSVKITNSIITGNVVTGFTQHGFRNDFLYDSLVANNVFSQNNQCGMILRGTIRCVITGNVMRDNDFDTNGTTGVDSSGLCLISTNGTTDNVITNNVCNVSNVASYQKYGISIGGSVGACHFANNVTASNRTSGLDASSGHYWFGMSAGRLYLGDPTALVQIVTGAATPEAAITAPVGSLFLRNDGGASTTLYVKTSGTGNTGWTAK